MTLDGSRGTAEEKGGGAQNPSSSQSDNQQRDASTTAEEKRLVYCVLEVVGAEMSETTILDAIRSSNLTDRSPADAVQAVLNVLLDKPQPSPAPVPGSEMDIERALAESLQDSGTPALPHLSKEEEDIGRAIEMSIKDRAFEAGIQEPRDPWERQRSPDSWPVGLQNVGGTCWFNVVLQVLFHLPSFRNQLLHCPRVHQRAPDATPSPSLRFLGELQKLLSVLLCSKRKYADPSQVVQFFREQVKLPENPDACFGSSAHQDASEAMHGLLGLLESAFNEALNEDADPSPQSPNPIQDLFFGRMKKFQQQGSGGAVEVGEESFSLLPLPVEGLESLEEAIEASLLSHQHTQTPSTSQLWFSALPPVLLLDLQRFSFCKEEKKTQKIHSRLSFPTEMFLDRFVATNRDLVGAKQKELTRLRAQLKCLQKNLEKYERFGSGKHPIPLTENLESCLEFVCGKADVHGALESPPSPPALDAMDTSSSALTAVPESMPLLEMEVGAPQSSQLSQEERQTMTELLSRMKAEVETTVADLVIEIELVQGELSALFDGRDWQQHPFQLFSVLVHEGQPNSGHYWAFIRDPVDQTWKKFNDIWVSSASWDSVMSESFGGCHFASAYTLIYIDANRAHAIFQGISEPGEEGLPVELRQLVEMDNAAFDRELAEWRPPTPPRSSSPPDDIAEKNLVFSSSDPSNGHLVRKVMDSEDNPDTLLAEELKKFERELSEGAMKFNVWGLSGGELPGLVDPRLRHVFALAVAFGLADEPSIHSQLLLQPFILALQKEPDSERRTQVLTSAMALLGSAPLKDDVQQKLQNIHEKFAKFREAAIVLGKLIMDVEQKDAESAMKFLLSIRMLLPGEDAQRFLYPKLWTNLALKSLIEVNARDSGGFLELPLSGRKRLRQTYNSLMFPLLRFVVLDEAPLSRAVLEAIQKQWSGLLEPESGVSPSSAEDLRPILSLLIDEVALNLVPFDSGKFQAKVCLSGRSALEVGEALSKAVELGLCEDAFIHSLLQPNS